jgi:hypothetical protein
MNRRKQMAGAQSTLQDSAQMQRLINASQKAAAATIVAALITASGRPHSVDLALELLRDVEFSLYPQPNLGAYQTWLQNKQTDKPHI